MKIPTLEGSVNYIEWRDIITLHLKANSSWVIVNGLSVRPEIIHHQKPLDVDEYKEIVPHVVEAHPNWTATQWQKNMDIYVKKVDRQKEWNERNDTAILHIFSSMSETCKNEVGPKEEFRVLWLRLIELYGSTKVPEINREISTFLNITIENYKGDYEQ